MLKYIIYAFADDSIIFDSNNNTDCCFEILNRKRLYRSEWVNELSLILKIKRILVDTRIVKITLGLMV